MNSKLFSILFLCSLVMISCNSPKNIIFSEEIFSLSKQSGNIINSDSTLQFSFGNHNLDYDMTIISCQDSLQTYIGADKYIYMKFLKLVVLRIAKFIFSLHWKKLCGLNYQITIMI